jgi:hypothetical protein
VDNILDRIGANCKLLHDGYHERVEYAVKTCTHIDTCEYHRKSSAPKEDCDCPETLEKRSRQIKRPGYLTQLRDFAKHKDVDRNLKAVRGAPRVKTAGKPPGDMGGLFALDELECEISATVDRILEEAGRDRSWACMPVANILIGLKGQATYMVNDGRDVRDLERATASWVRKAEAALKITVGQTMFEGMVCGNCSGALAIAADNSTEVRCIGSLADGSCGTTYGPSEWIELLKANGGGVDA